MRIKLLVYGSLLAGVLAISGPAFAHHAWHGYDMANLTTQRGTVTQFDWANPHVWIYLDVKDDKGNVEKWNAGGPSPSRMANTGWDKDTLKPGDQIGRVGRCLKSDSVLVPCIKVVLSDGGDLICYGGR